MSEMISRAVSPVLDSLEPRRLMAAGQIDPAFGTGGIVRTNVPGNLAQLKVAFGPGNSMLSSGYDVRGGSGATTVVRLTDPTGATGKQLMTYPITLAGVSDIGFASDGNVLVAGINRVNFTGFIDVFAPTGQYLTRLVAGKSLTAVTKAVDGDYYATGLFTDPRDNEIKNGIARINPDGTFDKTFDGDGIAFTTLTTVNDIFAQPSGGGVIVAGGEGDKSILRRYLPIGSAAEDYYNSTTPAINPVITRDGRMVFQIATADGGTEVWSSSTSVTGAPFAGDSLSSRAAGAPLALAANKDSVVSLTVTPGDGSEGNVTIKQFDKFGQAPVLQSIINFPGANIGLAAGVSGDTLAFARVVGTRDGDVSVYQTRVDLQPAVVPPVVGTATIAGVVFDDADGNTWRDNNESGVSGRQVFIDANNNGALDTGEKTATTDDGGYYEFKNLTAGRYVVRVGISLGSDATTFASGQMITVKDGESVFAGDFGQKQFGNPNTTPTPIAKPLAVTNVKAVLATVGKKKVARLTWTASATAGATYRIERRYRGESSWTSVVMLGATVKTFDDATFLKSVVYEYRVIAINPAGSTAGGAVSIKT